MERSTVGSLLRTTQAFCGQVCDKQTLDYGIAYYSERFADLPEANQFREVIVERPSDWPAAFAQAEDWFRRHGLFCYRWAPASGTPGEPMRAFLTDRGFRPVESTAMVLTAWVDWGEEPMQGIRVLPARAMRSAFRKTFLAGSPPRAPVPHARPQGSAPADVPSSASEEQRSLLADAGAERLNDPQFDMFVAVVDQQPAGRCALYQVGDIGRVMDLTVLPEFSDRGVEQALTAFVLTMGRRLAMRNVCAEVERCDERKRAWFEQAGFVEDGTIVEFVREPGGSGGTE